MDAKKVRNAGVISVLSLALALGAGLASSMSVGAQGQTTTGNDKPDPSQPIVRSISSKSIVVAIDADFTREVPVDALTLVVKDGKFAGMSALKVGDKVQVDPRIALPNGLEGHGTSASQPSQDNPENLPKSDEGRNDETDLPDGPGAGGASSPNTPADPSDPADPDNKEGTSVPSEQGQPVNGEGNTAGVFRPASVLWVTSNDDVLYTGVVHWAEGDTIVLNTPNVAYSEYVVHITNNTNFQQLSSAGSTPSSASAAYMTPGASVVVLGTDGGANNPGFFTAKAVLIVPASMKLR